MPSTAGATQATATIRREMLQRMLLALDAYHAAEQAIDDGRDPSTGADLADAAAKTVALDAAASGLTLAFHAAIDRAWSAADATARQTLWGGAEPTTQARRVLESETARQKAFASRFALDVARGETEEGRKIPEGTRAAMYAEASEAGYQVGASLNAPDGTLIWWVLAELSRHCVTTPDARVWTARGDVPIRDVVVGDLVMTHRGRFRPVTAVHAVPVEETSTNVEVTLTDGGRHVGLTGDHVLLSSDGWVQAIVVDCLRINPVTVPDEDVRDVWRGVQIPGPYEVPEVPVNLSVRAAEVPQSEGMHRVRPGAEDGTERGADGRPGVQGGQRGSNEVVRGRSHRDEARTGAQGMENAAGHCGESTHVGGLPSAREADATIRGGLQARGARQKAVPIQMGVGASQRPDSSGYGDPPHQRDHDGRSPGESPDDDRPGAQETPPADGGRVGPRRGVLVRHMRDGVPREQGEDRVQDGQPLLRSGMPGQVDGDPSFTPEGGDLVRGMCVGVRGRAGEGERPPHVHEGVRGEVHHDEVSAGVSDLRVLRGRVRCEPIGGGAAADLLEKVYGCDQGARVHDEGHEDLRRVRPAVQAGAVAETDDMFAGLRAAPKGPHRVGRSVGVVAPGALVYDLTVDGDHTFVIEGFIVSNCYLCPIHAANSPYTRESIPSSPRDGSTPCRTRCRCHLTFRPATGTGPIDPESTEKARPFSERIVNPPPVPPGLRLPTPEERVVMRDREIQLNFARRKAADAEDAGRRAEADLWYQKRKDLNAEAIAYANERKIHDVPTFRVGDVINGRDLGQRDIDRLTHFRGIDGVTVSRAQVAAIKEAVAAAKKNVITQLSQYPDIDAVSREEWRQALRDNGAPASAFGGELFRLGREATEHTCGRSDHGPMRVRQRPALDTLRAIEAAVPTVSDATLPSPADIQVVNMVGETARETLQNHLAALEVLAAAGRRTGVNPYRVELGPMDEDWPETVAVVGTWVQGEMSEVRRFLAALQESAPAGFAVAPWQPMG